MPTVAVVDGVRIVFYANEHPPPHFHAIVGEHRAVIEIARMLVTEGFLPPDKRRKVLAWAEARQAELLRAFIQATSHERVEGID